MKIDLVSLAIAPIVITISFLFYRFLSREMEKRKKMSEERTSRLEKTEVGREQLNREKLERHIRIKKIGPWVKWIPILAYSGFIFLGIVGVIIFFENLKGSPLEEIIFNHRGYYLMSPLMIIFGIFGLASKIKFHKNNM